MCMMCVCGGEREEGGRERVGVHQSHCVELRGQPSGVGSLFPPSHGSRNELKLSGMGI